MSAKLFYGDARGRQVSYLLRASGVRVGSAADCDLRMEGMAAHVARIYQSAQHGPWLLEAIAEVLINEQRVPIGATHTLTSNEVVRCGAVRLLFRTVSRRDTPTGMVVWPSLQRGPGSGGSKITAPQRTLVDPVATVEIAQPPPPGEGPVKGPAAEVSGATPVPEGRGPGTAEVVAPPPIALRPGDAILASRLASAVRALSEEQERSVTLREELEEARHLLKKERDEDARGRLQAALSEAERDRAALRQQRDRAGAQLERLEEEKAQLLGQLRTQEQQQEALRGVCAEQQQQLAVKQQALVQSEHRLRAHIADLTRSEERCGALQAQVEALQAREERQRTQLETLAQLRGENQRLREQLNRQGGESESRLVREVTMAEEHVKRVAKERDDLQRRFDAVLARLRPALGQLRHGLYQWEGLLPESPKERRDALTLLHKIEQAVLALRSAVHEAEAQEVTQKQPPEKDPLEKDPPETEPPEKDPE